MIRVIIFYALLLTVVLLALRHGDRETRLAALIAMAGSLLSAASVYSIGGAEPVEALVALVDLGVLAAFVFIALRSCRFWHLWVAGLQLTTVLAHILRLMSPDLVDIAYQTAMRFWSYPILVILAVAAWRTQRLCSLEPAST